MEPPASWVRRHVETLEIRGLRTATRNLTLDIALPTDAQAQLGEEGGDTLFCVPIARLNRENPTKGIDLRDERRRALPLLTLDENADISTLALFEAISRGAAEPITDENRKAELRYLASVCATRQRPLADLSAQNLRLILGDLVADPEMSRRLSQVVNQLVENSYLWTVLRGRPGERRVMKLSYQIDLGPEQFPVRKEVLEPYRYPGVDQVVYRLRAVGPIRKRKSLSAARAWLAALMGWDAIDLVVPDPVMQDPSTYHLQLMTPAGLVVDRMELRPAKGDPSIAKHLVHEHDGHLYLRGATPPRAVPISISMRVNRAGFMNLSMLSSALIAVALWCYQGAWRSIIDSEDKGTSAAAVLLVVPALLVLFATRPSEENPLSSALLSGVRSAVLVCGLAAGGAAAAIAGVRPTDSLSASLIIYAVLASACTVVIFIAYLGSFRWVRGKAQAARRWWCTPSSHAEGQAAPSTSEGGTEETGTVAGARPEVGDTRDAAQLAAAQASDAAQVAAAKADTARMAVAQAADASQIAAAKAAYAAQMAVAQAGDVAASGGPPLPERAEAMGDAASASAAGSVQQQTAGAIPVPQPSGAATDDSEPDDYGPFLVVFAAGLLGLAVLVSLRNDWLGLHDHGSWAALILVVYLGLSLRTSTPRGARLLSAAMLVASALCAHSNWPVLEDLTNTHYFATGVFIFVGLSGWALLSAVALLLAPVGDDLAPTATATSTQEAPFAGGQSGGHGARA